MYTLNATVSDDAMSALVLMSGSVPPKILSSSDSCTWFWVADDHHVQQRQQPALEIVSSHPTSVGCKPYLSFDLPCRPTIRGRLTGGS